MLLAAKSFPQPCAATHVIPAVHPLPEAPHSTATATCPLLLTARCPLYSTHISSSRPLSRLVIQSFPSQFSLPTSCPPGPPRTPLVLITAPAPARVAFAAVSVSSSPPAAKKNPPASKAQPSSQYVTTTAMSARTRRVPSPAPCAAAVCRHRLPTSAPGDPTGISRPCSHAFSLGFVVPD